MAEPFMIMKALDLSPRALGKSTFATLKGLLVIGAIIGIVWFIYVGAVKPHFNPIPTTTQKANKIENTYNYGDEEQFFFGVKLWGFKLGITKDKKVIRITQDNTRQEIK
jgi:hypothetical protein